MIISTLLWLGLAIALTGVSIRMHNSQMTQTPARIRTNERHTR
jgi:hypothetical protein